ncbi:hypothetical protein ACFLYR_09275 [Chloroflexota bacterium]
MSDKEIIEIAGYPVTPETLRGIWEDIRSELVSDFPIARSIEMPSVYAFVVPRKEYRRVFKQLKHSKHIINTEKTEWGEEGAPSTSAFAFKSERGWVILKRERFGYAVEADLKHELTHIWEEILGLVWGKLTRKTD